MPSSRPAHLRHAGETGLRRGNERPPTAVARSRWSGWPRPAGPVRPASPLGLAAETLVEEFSQAVLRDHPAADHDAIRHRKLLLILGPGFERRLGRGGEVIEKDV